MRRILVVDDSATMRSLYKQLLSHMKNTTLHFGSDGRQGLELYTSISPHLMFLDINMPEMNGLEVLAELTRTGDIKRAPVVLVTTEGKEADIQRGLAAGATEYLRKPFKLSDVKAIVDRLAPWNEAGAEAKGAEGGKASESGAAGGGR